MLVRTGDFDCSYYDDSFVAPWVTPSEVVVIQHGCGRSGDYWWSWVPDLAREHRLIRRDMRGHGRSSGGDPDFVWTPETLADDVVSFLDALGLDRVHYVGESLGGITGITLGARHPERLKTLTLVQTPLRAAKELNDMLRGDYPNWSARLRAEGPGNYAIRELDPEDPRTEWVQRQWDADDREALLSLTASLDYDVEHYLPEIAVPTLVLSPGRSPHSSVHEQLMMRETIPDAEIEVLEGSGHDIYLTEPRRCTARLLEFIAAHASNEQTSGAWETMPHSIR